MKKLIVLLLVLAVASSAFAQLTVGGYVRATATYSSDTKIAMPAERIRLNLDAKDPDGMYGFSGRFQGSAPLNGVQPKGTDYFYGWAKFAGGMGKVSMGYLDNTDYQFDNSLNKVYLVSGNVNAGFEYETDAMCLQLYPVAGFSVGIFYKPQPTTKLFDKANSGELAFGAAYAVEKLINVRTGWTLLADSKLAGHASVQYVGMDNLSAVVGVKMSNVALGKYTKIYTLDEYTMGAIFINAAFEYETEAKTMYFEGNVEYTGEGYAVRADFVYDKDLVYITDKTNFGVELSVPFAKKAEFNVGLSYGDVTKAVVPMFVKVSF